MGRVYEAHHIDIGRRVADQGLHASFLTSADLVERFRREARAASKIGHANIVDVTDSGTTPDGAFYFVMEYLDGTNLEDMIGREGQLPVERALLITGADHARRCEAGTRGRRHPPRSEARQHHAGQPQGRGRLRQGAGLRHLRRTSTVGRRSPRALTRPDVAIGTPVYMAPEQAAGRPADALTDVYAVGGLLYEC
jgi:serine/threonine-protein kinase